MTALPDHNISVSSQQFPILSNESVYLAITDAIFTTATLCARDGTVLAVAHASDMRESHACVEYVRAYLGRADATVLLFFGNEPFHAALATLWGTYVILADVQGSPKFHMIPDITTVTWTDTLTQYKVDIADMTRVFVYTRDRGGYMRI